MRKIKSEIGNAKKLQVLKAEGVGNVVTDKCVQSSLCYRSK